MPQRHRCSALLTALIIAGCAPSTPAPSYGSARQQLKLAESSKLSAEQRALLYLDVAREAASDLDCDPSGQARLLYNQAAAGLTILLRTEKDGTLWNRPLAVGSGASSHRLRFAKPTRDGVWDPAYFTAFTRAADVELKTIKRRNLRQGTGGALVGVRKTQPLEAFSPLVGVTAPVTAVLDFKGRDVTLSLIDPVEQSRSRIAGKERLLEADFSAPLAYYPQRSELWEGLMGAIRVTDYMKITGLYMLEPYDPDRIPLIFVHGLISTPRMWRNVINELETDPVIRERYQCAVFAYPTGNPPLYSSLRLREEIAKFYHQHPGARNAVLIGHSMGGILSRTQVTTVRRSDWNAIGEDKARRFFARVKPDDLIHRSTQFAANPRVDRAVFICTPHRGSKMAIGTIGGLAIRLISLPADLAGTVTSTLGDSIAVITGAPNRIPNSVSGLAPDNPSFKVLDKRPIEAPHHSIIGDRGKGGSPDSSDGVVEYWSSHLESARSEKIVPGPHGSCELPETIDELRRILHQHLSSN